MAYGTGFAAWRAREGGFAAWTLEGAVLSDSGGILAEGFPARATGPVLETPAPFRELIPSWNVETEDGSRVGILASARLAGGRWTGWYRFGTWSSSGPPGSRRSEESGDADGLVKTDTLVLAEDATALRLRLDLFPGPARLRLRNAFLAWSGPKAEASGSGPAGPAGRAEPATGPRQACLVPGVPASSQMVYPDGGKVWCSPTSLSMVLGYWSGDAGPAEARVRAAVAGTYDGFYEGWGNWAFNAAWAGSLGYEAAVLRFQGLDELEPLVRAGIPLVLSVAWNEEKGRPLPGAPISSSSGHLTTLVGFDGEGNALMHEPASPDEASVRRTYPRAALEARWLEASGGAAYLVLPEGRAAPLAAPEARGRAAKAAAPGRPEGAP